MSNVASVSRPFTWWGFLPFAVVSAIHVIGNFFPDWPGDNFTKLLLIPMLVLAVMWSARGANLRDRSILSTLTWLIVALAFSWLGDGAATFFPALPTLPVMLGAFGVTHLIYIWLFWKKLAVRRLPIWTLVYAAWWITLLAVLLPHTGSLAVAVALYGLVLGGTATLAARCKPLIVWGAALFLTSDSVLAFRLFLLDLMPLWTSPLVMLTYCAGQALIAAGIVRTLVTRSGTPS